VSGKEGPVEKWVRTKTSDGAPAAGVPASLDLPQDVADGVPQVGELILGGKYEVERIIGVGGMGVVVSALHKKLEQRVAFKFLLASMRTNEFSDRFQREGRAAAKVQSEHIARVHDVGVLENGTPYLMMEYLVGADLADYLADQGALPIEDAVDFIIQACDALASAHASGVIHRDLKPSNLFVTRRSDGSALLKVLDFGISKLAQIEVAELDPRANLTRPGTLLGSPMYMSPEQLENAKTVDQRTDIWAIGVVLHQLVVGTPMFESESFLRLASTIMNDPPPSLADILPDAPPALERIIHRCVEKNPANRYPSVAELAADLAPLASDEGRVLAARVAKGAKGSTQPSSTQPRSSLVKDVATRPDTPAGRRTPAGKGDAALRDSARILVGDSGGSGLDRTTPLDLVAPSNNSASPIAANLAISTNRAPPPAASRRWVYAACAAGALAVVLLVMIVSHDKSRSTDAPASASVAAAPTVTASAVTPPSSAVESATPPNEPPASASAVASASAPPPRKAVPRKPAAGGSSAKPGAKEGDLLQDRQ